MTFGFRNVDDEEGASFYCSTSSFALLSRGQAIEVFNAGYGCISPLFGTVWHRMRFKLKRVYFDAKMQALALKNFNGMVMQGGFNRICIRCLFRSTLECIF